MTISALLTARKIRGGTWVLSQNRVSERSLSSSGLLLATTLTTLRRIHSHLLPSSPCSLVIFGVWFLKLYSYRIGSNGGASHPLIPPPFE